MAPADWQLDATVTSILSLPEGGAWTSKWPPIQAAVRTYKSLQAAQVVQRAQVLTQLEQAIATWRANQLDATFSNLTKSKKKLLAQKHGALNALDLLIAIERAELRPPAPVRLDRDSPPPFRRTPALTAPSLYPSSSSSRPPSPVRRDSLSPPAFVGTPPFFGSFSSSPPRSPERKSPPPFGHTPPFTESSSSSSSFAPPSSSPLRREPESPPPFRRTAAFAASSSAIPIRREEGTARVKTRSDLSASLRGSYTNPSLPVKVAVSPDKKDAFARTVNVYVHFTKTEYKVGIFESGLEPGKQQGIGLPNDSDVRERDKRNVYVLSGSVSLTTSSVTSEAGSLPVVVVSRTVPTSRDVNYREGGAYYFAGGLPPIRAFGQTQGQTFSFVLPLTPRTKHRLWLFVQAAMPTGIHVSADEAEALVRKRLRKLFPLYFRD